MELQAGLSDNMRQLEEEMADLEDVSFYKRNSGWIRSFTLIIGI
tara:strand:+ start:146 stop:277 length:132 start_codon:yes stop_codon:yes gene_type:complete